MEGSAKEAGFHNARRAKETITSPQRKESGRTRRNEKGTCNEIGGCDMHHPAI